MLAAQENAEAAYMAGCGKTGDIMSPRPAKRLQPGE